MIEVNNLRNDDKPDYYGKNTAWITVFNLLELVRIFFSQDIFWSSYFSCALRNMPIC